MIIQVFLFEKDEKRKKEDKYVTFWGCKRKSNDGILKILIEFQEKY